MDRDNRTALRWIAILAVPAMCAGAGAAALSEPARVPDTTMDYSAPVEPVTTTPPVAPPTTTAPTVRPQPATRTIIVRIPVTVVPTTTATPSTTPAPTSSAAPTSTVVPTPTVTFSPLPLTGLRGATSLP